MAILNPAPAWQPDRSEYVILWHGCTDLERKKIETKGIELKSCMVNTDFGRGFYTTTVEQQARQWAWRRFSDWQQKNPKKSRNQPVTLRFQARRYTAPQRMTDLDDGLNSLSSLHFVLGDFGSEDYWSLVQHCRQITPGDGKRKIKEVVHDHKSLPGGWYDLVAGPVAAFWKQRAIMQGADQYSFHTPRAIGLLESLIKAESPHYEWLPVT